MARRKLCGAGNAAGFSLLEVMIAAFLVLLVFLGLAQLHMRGRSLLSLHETRRQASALALSVLDDIRANTAYDGLPDYDADTRDLDVDGRDFTIVTIVSMEDPDANSATVTVDVSWNEVVDGGDVARTLSFATILGRSVYWPD